MGIALLTLEMVSDDPRAFIQQTIAARLHAIQISCSAAERIDAPAFDRPALRFHANEATLTASNKKAPCLSTARL